MGKTKPRPKEHDTWTRHEAIKGLAKEIQSKVEDLFADDWKKDAHVEITLTIAECREFVLMNRERKQTAKGAKFMALMDSGDDE